MFTIVIAIGALVIFATNTTIPFKGEQKMTITSESDKTAVITAYNNFYIALNDLFIGNTEKMLTVWSHADDVTYMGPDNVFLKGWKDISAIWEFQASKKLGGKVLPQDVRIVVGQDIAVTTNYEMGENVDGDGNFLKVSIRATNTFRKEDGQWKMIGHHTDLLTFLDAK
ncbi:MAG: SnoaL-like domain-containing protein [Gammaproteobacteria bacterium]|nr:SnoaL-like domain-containing protein [Gammaproteobacteria bacterium]MBT6420649.1 SnoaL-like domain-containing protein [Gammaproteobacteria bacterium]MBT6574669.1 SnoaL-like domain-containing protein [Gammaproteobacteria bacterium]